MKSTPKNLLIILITLLWGIDTIAQNKPGEKLSIRKSKAPIVIDGVLDEADWQSAHVAKDFHLNFPIDTAQAPYQTEVRMTFDDHTLYLGFTCFDDGKPYIMQSLKRDFDFDNTDNVAVLVGPYNDKINGFFFVITPYNVQMEGTINSGGADNNSYSATWDNKWYSKVTRHADRWVAELAIPFKSFRYKSGEDNWNINFLRWDRKHNLVSTWIATPIQYNAGSFAYSGNLHWEDKAPESSTNISLIPYVAGISSVDKQASPEAKTNDLQAGLDAKVGVTPSLNLDLTINPDFSQVEVDQQVINLTRFEFQFPERRQFFLENNDLYDKGGFPSSRPFFSRRIGLARDSSGNLQKVPIAYGARLSGSISKKWRVSALNMQTKKMLALGLPAQNYTVAALQRNFWKQSNLTLMYVDKASIDVNKEDTLKYFQKNLWKYKKTGNDSSLVINNSNRVWSADLELLSPDNSRYGSFSFSQSIDPFNTNKRTSGIAFFSYNKRPGGFFLGRGFIQKNYNAETGFVPPSGVYPGWNNNFLNAYKTFYPKKWIAKMGPGININYVSIPGGTIADKNLSVNYSFNFLTTAQLNFTVSHVFQKMTNTFNPIDGEKYFSFITGEEYNWTNYSARFVSDQRKIIRYTLEATTGGFYNGNNLNLNGQFNVRFQPYGSFSVRFDYNDLRLAEGYGNAQLLLVRPRFDFTFTDKLFFSAQAQYNNLADNVNLNARFQWRYKPASDFFIVYTENYLPGSFASKNRALVFKFTYWLNI